MVKTWVFFNKILKIFERVQGKTFCISIHKHKSEALCFKVSPVFHLKRIQDIFCMLRKQNSKKLMPFYEFYDTICVNIFKRVFYVR